MSAKPTLPKDRRDRTSLDAFGPEKREFLLRQRDSGQVCFIHINKCGGSSIKAALGIPKVHDTALQRIAKIGRPAWNRMWSFSTVRHPFARVCSLYHFRRKRDVSRIASDEIGLDDWIARAFDAHQRRFYNVPLMFAPAVDWLSDASGRILVDAVFDIAALERHWPEIARHAGVATWPKWQNTTHRFTVETATRLLSNWSRRIIERHFAADFERFGYEVPG